MLTRNSRPEREKDNSTEKGVVFLLVAIVLVASFWFHYKCFVNSNALMTSYTPK